MSRKRSSSISSSSDSDSSASSVDSAPRSGRRSAATAIASGVRSSTRKHLYRSLPEQGTTQGYQQPLPAPGQDPYGGQGQGQMYGNAGNGQQQPQKPKSKTCCIISIVAALLVVAALVVVGVIFREELVNFVNGKGFVKGELSTSDPTATAPVTTTPLAGTLTSDIVNTATLRSPVTTPISGTADLNATAAPTSTRASVTSTPTATTNSSSSSTVAYASNTYTLAQTCAGDTFFDCFSFNTAATGRVNREDAEALDIVSCEGESCFMRIDSWTDTTADGERKGTFIESTKQYRYFLTVLDLPKMPWGCGTWPSFFSYGADWPAGGGIDTLEGISLMTQSTPTVVASDSGCEFGSTDEMTSTPLEGQLECDSTVVVDSGYAGCSVQNPSTSSYGEAWNANGGGVLATLVDKTGIFMWQWARADVPADVDTPDPASWGLPLAAWPASTCKPSYFTDQTFVFGNGVCGTRPEALWESSGCSEKAASCSEWAKTGAIWADAVWEVKSLKIYDAKAGSGGVEDPGA